MKKTKKILKWSITALVMPIVLFLALAVIIYIPPVQNFVVHKVAKTMSERMGMNIRIDKVRLAFPLDLAIHNMTAVEQRDTLINVDHLRLNVKLAPLFEGRADVDGFNLYGLKLNTKSLISDVQIKGYAEALSASTHGIDWKNEFVKVDNAHLCNADLHITLSDTAQKDTTESKLRWRIDVKLAQIERSKVHLIMPGDSMRIYANLNLARMRKGVFDIGKNAYSVHSFLLKKSAINYDIPYQKRVEGLDANHLSFTGVSLLLDTLSYSNDVLQAGLRRLMLKEKSGLYVHRLQGNVYMDSTQLRLPMVCLETSASKLQASVAFDFKSFNTGNGGHFKANVDANIGSEDIKNLSKGYIDKHYLKFFPLQPLIVKGEISGNIDHIRIPKINLSVPTIAQVSMNGYVHNVVKNWRKGKLNFNLRTQDLHSFYNLFPLSVRQTINLPNGLSSHGWISFCANNYNTNLMLTCGGGSVATRASVNLTNESYRASLTAQRFPLAKFVKNVPLTPFTGNIQALGKRFDVLSTHALLHAKAHVNALSYQNYNLSGISINAHLNGGKVTSQFIANNPLLQGNGDITANIGTRGYQLTLNASLPNIDFNRLGITQDTLSVGTSIHLQAATNKALTAYSLSGSVMNNHFTSPKMSVMAKDINFNFSTTPDTTSAFISAGDLIIRLASKGDISALSSRLTHFANQLTQQAKAYNIDQEKLKSLLPQMSLMVEAGQDNPLCNIARMKGYSFSSAKVHLNAHPLIGLNGDARIGKLGVGALLIDTIDTHIFQDSTGVQMQALVKNNKKNANPLEVRAKSYLMQSGAGVELTYFDSEGERGVDLGLQALLQDKGINIHFYPQHPILAYRNFTVNKDNYIFLGNDKSIRANVDLLADDGTGLKIYGEPKDSINDLTLSINQLNLGELSTVLPYLPSLSGMLSGDIHVTQNPQEGQLTAMASLGADNFKYEDTPLGNVGIDAIYLPKTGGEHHASAFISSNGEEVLACNGTYYDKDGGLFEGDAQLHDFPLQMLNGFMTGTDVLLKGIAAGDLNIAGRIDKPSINGSLTLDSAHVYSDVYGFDFVTDQRAVSIDNSKIVFKDYNLYSTGKNPLVLNGTFDMSDFNHMYMDFSMKANNFELINTQKKAKSMVFGKVYANYLGTLKGTTDNLSLRGKLEVLDRTDVTYILKDSPLSVEDRLHDLVQFTNFADSTTTDEKRLVSNAGVDLILGISISDAAQFHCILSDDGKSYVNLEGGGDLTLRMTQQGDMRMTGRFTTNSGEMKYQLPIIPLKTFQLVQGSYVEFTGDVMNPTLSIAAKERTKALVSENDKQRSVSFDVGVKLSKPLNDMGLEFTIEAPEDLNVQNQLAAMSAEQRGKAAVTMMATGMYMTDETMMSGTGFKANNALNAFLQNEIQNIAGSALKTIDINLGVESGTSQTGTSTTDYSFQFAKRFWGNRISVIIGGKVSTGVDATNSAQSFINNISVEYRLDQGATRYVKCFYDRNTQDPLEGQLTKTGVGLVLRRKTDRLGELFLFKKKNNK